MTEFFYKITNKEIYDKLLDIEERLTNIEKKSGIVKWMAGSALAISTFLVGLLLNGGIR